MYNIECKTIPAIDMRYATLGDYFTELGTIHFRVSSFGNADYEFLVFLHEVVEKQLARKMGISEQAIDAWDLSHEDAEEPGELPDCPYREAHMRAEAIERVVAVDLGVDWDDYCKACKEVMAQVPKIPDDVAKKREHHGWTGYAGLAWGDRPKKTFKGVRDYTRKPSKKVIARSVLKDKEQ